MRFGAEQCYLLERDLVLIWRATWLIVPLPRLGERHPVHGDSFQVENLASVCVVLTNPLAQYVR